MPYRSTIDEISAVHLLIEKTYEFRKDRHLYIGFIDLKAAFDTVCQTSLWSVLHELGVPPKIIALFKLLYSNDQSCVCINGRDSSTASSTSGFPIKCLEPALASPEHPPWPQNVTPAGLAMSSASLLTIRRELFSSLIRRLQAGDNHEVNPAPDGLTSLRATFNYKELLKRMRSSSHKTVSAGNN
ncbi:gamma-aminobutyric acid receptor subunit alpha-2-like [Tachysurus ichikawai]